MWHWSYSRKLRWQSSMQFPIADSNICTCPQGIQKAFAGTILATARLGNQSLSFFCWLPNTVLFCFSLLSLLHSIWDTSVLLEWDVDLCIQVVRENREVRISWLRRSGVGLASIHRARTEGVRTILWSRMYQSGCLPVRLWLQLREYVHISSSIPRFP